jgi:general stress protein YciG
MTTNQRGSGSSKSEHDKRSEAAKKAAETRKANDPHAFEKMGQKGGSQSHKNS